MDFLKSISVAASGLRAQSGRMRVIAENVANADSTADKPGADPYRRKVPTFQRHFDRALEANVVDLGKVQTDQSAFRSRFEPGHPAADAQGQVKLPNVNSLVETMDMREAQRSYEANLNLITATRRMISRTLDILRA
jgi:flagellar basal-body rod protein FlgC